MGRDPAVERAIRVDHGLGYAVVAHDDLEVVAAADRAPRRHDELLAVTREPGLSFVHRDAIDREAPQIDVEAVEPLGGDRIERRLTLQLARRRIERQLEVVVADVVPAVAGEREEAVSEAARTGRARWPGRGVGGRSQRHQHGYDRDRRPT